MAHIISLVTLLLRCQLRFYRQPRLNQPTNPTPYNLQLLLCSYLLLLLHTLTQCRVVQMAGTCNQRPFLQVHRVHSRD